MTLQTTKVPYEVLFRFDEAGALAGSHVLWRVVTREDGAVVAEAVLPAEPVAVGSQTGFPLDDLLNEVLQGALLRADAAEANRDEALKLRDVADAEKTAALSERDAALADAALAREEMNAARAALKVDGPTQS